MSLGAGWGDRKRSSVKRSRPSTPHAAGVEGSSVCGRRALDLLRVLWFLLESMRFVYMGRANQSCWLFDSRAPSGPVHRSPWPTVLPEWTRLSQCLLPLLLWLAMPPLPHLLSCLSSSSLRQVRRRNLFRKATACIWRWQLLSQSDGEGRALTHLALNADLPPVHLDDAIADRQPEAGPLADRLGREKR